MARNYKTGPRRSRRRPDPAFLKLNSQSVAIVGSTGAAGGPGTLQLVYTMLTPQTMDFYPGDYWHLTNRTTAVFFQHIGTGQTFTPDIVTLNAFGGVDMQWTGGLPAGDGYVIVPFGDPAIRGKNGEFVGTHGEPVTIT